MVKPKNFSLLSIEALSQTADRTVAAMAAPADVIPHRVHTLRANTALAGVGAYGLPAASGNVNARRERRELVLQIRRSCTPRSYLACLM